MALFVSGHLIARELEEKLKANLAIYKSALGIIPVLVIITVGENKVNSTLVGYKRKLGRRVGIVVVVKTFPENVTEEELLRFIRILNTAKSVHGIALQLHFPKHLNAGKLCNAVAIKKDVNGFSTVNRSESESYLFLDTCFGRGIEECIDRYGIIVQKKVVGIVVDKEKNIRPLVRVMNGYLEMIGENDVGYEQLAKSYLYTGDSNQFTSFCRKADILITMCSTQNIIKANMVKPNATIIDLGICPCRQPSGEVIVFGNTDLEEVKNVASAILPTPGTFAPITIVALMQNVFDAATLF